MDTQREELRKLYREKRNLLSAGQVLRYSETVSEKIAKLPGFRKASKVLIYSAVGNELSLESLVSHPASSGKSFAYPLCTEGRGMKALIPGGWRKGAYGISEPDPETSAEISPEEIDLVICPGVSFDSECRRLGMGGGYYDRFLPGCRNAAIIMAAFEVQHGERIPAEAWDIPMDMVVTEQHIYEAPFSEGIIRAIISSGGL